MQTKVEYPKIQAAVTTVGSGLVYLAIVAGTILQFAALVHHA
jgi:hypothetical protein